MIELVCVGWVECEEKKRMMKGLNFEYKNFSNQDLSNWFLVGANLRGANLSETNLTGATYNKQTIFPDGFDPIAAGMKKVDTEFLLW